MSIKALRARQTEELAALRAKHLEEEREALRAALVAADWSLSSAARALGLPVSSLQSTLDRRHPGLAAERRRR